MKRPRNTKRTKLMAGSITDGYTRLTPAEDDSVSIYREDGAVRMRFSDETEAQEWADRYHVTLRPDGTSYWVDLTHKGGFDLYAVSRAWEQRYMAVAT